MNNQRKLEINKHMAKHFEQPATITENFNIGNGVYHLVFNYLAYDNRIRKFLKILSVDAYFDTKTGILTEVCTFDNLHNTIEMTPEEVLEWLKINSYTYRDALRNIQSITRYVENINNMLDLSIEVLGAEDNDEVVAVNFKIKGSPLQFRWMREKKKEEKAKLVTALDESYTLQMHHVEAILDQTVTDSIIEKLHNKN